MKKMIQVILIVAVLLLLLFVLGSKGLRKQGDTFMEKTASIQVNENEAEHSMEQDVRMIQKTLKIDQDCAEGIVEKLDRKGIQMKTLKRLGKKRGTQATLVAQDGKVYYIALNEMGYLECIRENDQSGAVVYAELDD